MTEHDGSNPVEASAEHRTRLLELIWGYAPSQAIYVAAELGIAELLEAGWKSARELAEATSTDLWTLRIVLRALAALDVLSEDRDERFALTPMGNLLRRSSPGSVCDHATLLAEVSYPVAAGLLHATRTGGIAFNRAREMSFYEYLGRNPGTGEKFNRIMLRIAPDRYADLPSTFDFTRVSTLVDVGAGEGGLSCLLLKAYPHLKAVLFDSPEVISRARDRINAEGLQSRCELVGGSFFDSVPQGGDTYLLASVLNNWRDESALRIVRNCRSAMGDGGRLLVVEARYVPGAATAARAGLALTVLAERGGGVRSEAQYRALFEAGGLRLDHIRPLDFQNMALIEALPV